MTDMTRQYSVAASHARNAVDKTAGFWTRGTGTMMDLLPRMSQVDLVLAVEGYFNLMQRTVEINRRLAVRWAEAAATLSGVVRETAESAGDVVRERAEAAGNVAREQAEQAERAAREQAERAERERARQAERKQAEQAERAARERAERAERELARQARQAEREQARRAHERARGRYESLTKAELSDLLAKRNLPRTGNVGELIERLVEADSK